MPFPVGNWRHNELIGEHPTSDNAIVVVEEFGNRAGGAGASSVADLIVKQPGYTCVDMAL
jgi:hypothetical protein